MRKGKVLALVTGLLSVALIGGQLAASAAETPAPPPGSQLLWDGPGDYPRVIRLEHSGDANGRLISSVRSFVDGGPVGIIQESVDGGQTFQHVGTIVDPEGTADTDMCCGSLYELPRQVGAMPAGTLLWANTVGFKVPEAQRHTKQRLWQSADHGRTWTFVSDIFVSPNQYNGWEPELSVSADGHLVAFWADESDKPAHDQKLSQVRSADGITWTDQRDTVINSDFYVRPGMPIVRQLPDGTYVLAYEVCNLDEPLCSLYFRTSADGWDYGDPNNLGTGIRTADGKYPRHTPNLTITPGGAMLVISEMLVNADGSHADGNGTTILVNDQSGQGPWREIAAPVPVAQPDNSGCRNFSPTILASADGTTVMEIATELTDGVCQAFYATGPIPPA